MTSEAAIERHLVKCVKQLGGEVRKVAWVGRRGAPDRFVMLPLWCGAWVELKNPKTVETFPADARERAQAREHKRMREMGQTVLVLGTKEAIDDWLRVHG